MAGVIQERMKKLQESTVSDNVVLKVLANIGLSNHGILAVETCMFILFSMLVENSKGIHIFAQASLTRK